MEETSENRSSEKSFDGLNKGAIDCPEQLVVSLSCSSLFFIVSIYKGLHALEQLNSISEELYQNYSCKW